MFQAQHASGYLKGGALNDNSIWRRCTPLGALGRVEAAGQCHTLYAVACTGEGDELSLARGTLAVVGWQPRGLLGIHRRIFSCQILATVHNSADPTEDAPDRMGYSPPAQI